MIERDLLVYLDKILGEARYTLYKLHDTDVIRAERLDAPLAVVGGMVARRIRAIDRVARKRARSAIHADFG